VSPFGHLLLGGAHNSTRGVGSSSFSMALGGGIDAELPHGIHWHLIQMDYVLTQFGGGSQNNFRFSTGVLLKFSVCGDQGRRVLLSTGAPRIAMARRARVLAPEVDRPFAAPHHPRGWLESVSFQQSLFWAERWLRFADHRPRH